MAFNGKNAILLDKNVCSGFSMEIILCMAIYLHINNFSWHADKSGLIYAS